MKYTNAIVWDHRGRVPKGGMGQVEIRITFNRKSYHFGTGVKCHKSEFVSGQIINCPGADELNKRVSIIYSKVLACVNEAIDGSGVIDTEAIRQQVWKQIEVHSDEPTFLQWVETQIPRLDVKEGTRKHYDTLLLRLTEYNKIRRWQDVTVENIVEFDYWLHQLKAKANDTGAKANGRLSNGLSDGTIWNYHTWLKSLLYRAYKFGRIEKNPYEKLHGQFNRGAKENVEYLTEDEMKKIMKLKLSDDSTISFCRDLFVFQMWTGLSYSDALAFDISQYKKVTAAKACGHGVERWVYVGERVKTGVAYVSQLLPPVVKILKKHDWQVPHIENHVYNRMLKAIGEMAGIKTRLHSHLARHSFATYMLSNGVPIEHVSKMVGHTSIRQTQRYAKVLAQDIHDDYDMVATKLAKM